MQKFAFLITFLFYAITVFCQEKELSGTVINKTSKDPMQGVTVQTKNRTTITDANGKFSILVSMGETVSFSYVGMKAASVRAGNNLKDFAIELEEERKELEQVVVTGYQTQKKVDLTGAVSVVNIAQVKDIPTANPMQALQGRVPGLYIETSGVPNGSNRRVLIRGLNTLGDASPLYVIDGVPTKRAQVFSSLNPNSIASIQVLKDASASSIYGSRASNGVIIVTTKEGLVKGAQEKISIQFNSSISAQTEKPWREDVLNAEERGRALWRAAVNDKTNPTVHKAIYTYDWNGDYNNPVLNKVNIVPYVGGDLTEPVGNTDWQKETYKTAIINSQDLTITAGTRKTSLLINLGYYKNTGMIVYTNFNRYSIRINSSTTLFNDKLKIGENFELSRSSEVLSTNDLGGASVPNLAITLSPTIPVYTTDGKYAGALGAGYPDRNNPVHMQYINRWDKNNELLLFGNVYAQLEPVKNLFLKTNFGVDYSSTLNKNIDIAFKEGFLARTVNSLSKVQTYRSGLTWSNTINYQFDWGQSQFNLLGGSEAILQNFDQFGAYREGFAVQTDDYIYFNAGSGRSTNSGSGTGNRLFSYFGKINYSFSNRYLAAATLRRDGSSRFGSENRYGLFPAFSIGWRINNETFFSNISAVSDLKLRAGIGRVGNQEIGDAASFALFEPRYGTLQGLYHNIGTAYDLNQNDGGALPSGFVSVQGGNSNLKWESTDEMNLGVDFGFLNNKISGTFDYFIRKTYDILIQPPIASAIGEGKLKWLNGASKSNRGWEFLLNYTNTAGAFTYTISANAAHFSDKITSLPEEVRTAYPGNVEKTILGHSQASIFGYKTDGIFQTQAEVDAHATQTGKGIGRIRYKDLNKDGKIDALDQDWLGTTLPDLEFGLRIDLGYKNFDLSIFGSGVAGKNGTDPMKSLNSFAAVGSNNGKGVLHAWTPQNPNSRVPMLSLVNNNNETRPSDFFTVNGSYFRLRNVQLGYSLPTFNIRKVSINSLRFYLIGQNLFVLKSKEYTSKDPERIGSLDFWPLPTTITAGLSITL
ncbi:SusC/RagA family TonB-linked outer membrane protein [Terrimonas alba]|uniref:SusC/RagA family TonB-linked outer membrane protein n=1 Tax=Terrimonas alba TaxID=3349636 RepID=UPI0035F30FA5